MGGHLLEERLEDLGGAQVRRVGLVGGGGGLGDGERPEDAGLGVAGVVLRDLAHRRLVGHDARALGGDIGAREQTGHGVDVALLTPGRRAGGLGLLDGGLAGGDGLRRAQTAEGIAPVRERHAPVRHRAARILGGDRLEVLTGLREPEGMQQRHRPVHVGLDRRRARGLKVHRAHLLRRQRSTPVGVVLCERRWTHQTRRDHGDTGLGHCVCSFTPMWSTRIFERCDPSPGPSPTVTCRN